MAKSEELLEVLDSIDSLAILCHYQPDPDCLASAFTLQWVAEQAGVEQVDILYRGNITHQEIRTFINIFEIPILKIQENTFEAYNCAAFIDHSVSGTEIEIPDDISVDIIIDTQEQNNDLNSPFIDSRPDYGATSTILTEYIQELELSPSVSIASALLFAIHHERLDHVRYPSLADYRAAVTLCPAADIDLIEEVYGSSLTPATLEAVKLAIRYREKQGSTLVSSIGRTTENGALPQATEYLLRLEGVRTVLVMGVVDHHLWLSAQSFDPRIDIGAVLQQAFAEFGSAGGHPDRAGGQLSLGLFADVGEHTANVDEHLFNIVGDRFFQTINSVK